MKIKLLTVDPTILKWKSLEKKKAEILEILNSGKNADFTAIDIEERFDLTPEMNSNGRISHKWLDETFLSAFKAGYDFVGLHFDNKNWRKIGLPSSLRGANPIDGDVVGEFYCWAGERTSRRYAKGKPKVNQFIQVVVHEILHEYFRGAGLPDPTHARHYTEGDIRKLASEIDWSLYRPVLKKFRETESLFIRVARKAIERLTGQINELREELKYTPPTYLVPKVERAAEEVTEEMKRLGYEVRITQGYRSFKEQTKLYNKGRTTKGNVVTNAKAGESFHNYGVAVDFVFKKEGYKAHDLLWEVLGLVGKKYGFEWGGDWEGFVDRPHFQMKLGHSLSDFQNRKVDYSKFN